MAKQAVLGLFLVSLLLLSEHAAWAQYPTSADPGKKNAFGPVTMATLEPNQALNNLESDIKELMAENDKGVFDITPAESEKVKAILSAMYLDIIKLHAKYHTAKGDVDTATFYKEIEATLDKNERNAKSLILSLKRKGISAKSHECENFCWESCGHNSVGEWVCFLTCRRHCT